jgi:hypothetical protein
MDLVGFLKYAGSAARTSTVKQAGFSDRSIRAAVAGGEIARRRRGVLALPVAHEDIVETQVELPGIGIVDFLLEGRLIVEVDGESHLQPRQVKKDRRRNNAGTVKGFLVLRYDYSQIVYQPETVLAEVLQVLRQKSR